MTEGQARKVKGTTTARSTRGRNIAAGLAIGGAAGLALGHRMDRRKAYKSVKMYRAAKAAIKDGIRRGALNPHDAQHLRSRVMFSRVKDVISDGSFSRAWAGGGVAAGLTAGRAIGKARDNEEQKARYAVNDYDFTRSVLVPAERKKTAKSYDSLGDAARKVRHAWRRGPKEFITRGPVQGALVGAGVGALGGAATAGEGKGLRDASIGAVTGAMAGAFIGKKYQRPEAVVRGARYVSDAEAAAMSAKGFYEPLVDRSRRFAGKY